MRITAEKRLLGLRFFQIPRAMAEAKEISWTDKAVWMCLRDWAETNPEVFVGREKIAYQLGISVPSVSRSAKVLAEHGWIKVTVRKPKTNLYQVHIPDKFWPTGESDPLNESIRSVATDQDDSRSIHSDPDTGDTSPALRADAPSSKKKESAEARSIVIGAWRDSFSSPAEVIEPTGRDLAEIPRSWPAAKKYLDALPARLKEIRLHRLEQGWDPTLFACLQNISRPINGHAKAPNEPEKRYATLAEQKRDGTLRKAGGVRYTEEEIARG